MLEKFFNKYERVRYYRHIRAILDTMPIAKSRGSRLAVLTQLQHKDVLSYLVALKSFAHSVPVSDVYILNDGTLTESDVRILDEHTSGCQVLSLADFKSQYCPSGGCWERLLAISALVRENYVIQLDSDTVTLGDLQEVKDAVSSASGFVLGTWDKQEFETMPYRVQKSRARLGGVDGHVQLVAEANFDSLRNYESLRYVRGCAGFSGFPAQSFSREWVEDISEQLGATLGEKWAEWGSEQTMSNIVVANMAKSVVLPHPKYADCIKRQHETTEFVHFIGTCRFRGSSYRNTSLDAIRKLS